MLNIPATITLPKSTPRAALDPIAEELNVYVALEYLWIWGRKALRDAR